MVYRHFHDVQAHSRLVVYGKIEERLAFIESLRVKYNGARIKFYETQENYNNMINYRVFTFIYLELTMPTSIINRA